MAAEIMSAVGQMQRADAREESARIAALRKQNGPLLLAERAREAPSGVAYRAKDRGIYRERSWRFWAAQAGRFAVALKALGLAKGDRLAVMGDPFEEWAVCDLGAQAMGAITYGIYPTASAAEVQYQLRHGGAKVFVAENQEYVDKVLDILDEVPELEAVIVIDDSAMFAYELPILRSFDALIGRVDISDEEAISHLESCAKSLSENDPAFIVYTSGTTGHPKGALITHGAHLAAACTIVEHYPSLLDTEQRTVVFLPMCHILGRDLAITFPLISRVVPHYGESLEDLPETFFEVAPTMLLTVPRYLQKYASQLLIGIADSSPLKKRVYEAAARIGRECVRDRWNGKDTWRARLSVFLCRAMAFRPMLNKIGFDRLELIICGGAPLPRETAALWQIYGIRVVEIYGQTETAGALITGQVGSFARPGTVGVPPTGWEVRLSETGEVLVRSPDMFSGYWGDPESTAEVLDAQGWLHTGDVGEIVDGALRLVDRSRDFIVTDGGKTISPTFIENIVRSSPYVAEVIVFGHARKYLTALIEIEYDAVCQWARSKGLTYTGYTSLVEQPALQQLLQQEIDAANSQLSRAEQIKKFRVLPKMLDPEEEGEPVTPTRKVKRSLMQKRFAELIESMYDDFEARVVAQGAGAVVSADL